VPRGFTGDQVTNGTVEFAVQQVSELMNVPGVDVVGRFPTAIGRDAVFSAGILAASARKTEAAELIRFLASTDVAPVMERFGLESMSG
jgi:molybdate transport system substrate-binding protein